MADVVGLLRTVLTLDTASFTTEAKKAEAATVSLDKTLAQLGKETDRLSAQGEKLVKSFGGQKLLTQANDMTAAVARFGGVAKLTSAEQTRINATVTAAIDKYRALGQQAPKAMLELQAATKGAAVATNTFGISLRQVQTIAATFGISLGAGALVAFGRDLLQIGDELVRVADRTGLTAEEVQKLQFIAKQSGNSLEELTGAISRLQNNLVSGDKSAVAAVKFLGFNLQALKAESPFDQMADLATAIAKIPDPAQRAAVAIDLFGRSGAAILPTLISNFKALGDEAPIMSNRTAAALDRIGDELSKSAAQFKAWAAEGFVFAFELASRAFDRFVILIQRGTASVIEAQARMLELLAQIPGLGFAFQKLGIDIAEQRKQAALLRESAHALELQLGRVEPIVRKNTGAMMDYEGAVKASSAAVKDHTKATDEHAKALVTQFRALGLLIPSFKDNQASLTAYDLIVTNSVETMGDWAASAREAQAELQKLGLLPLPSFASPEASRQLEQRSDRWKEFAETIKGTFESLNTAIAGSFAQMALGAKHFKDGFIDIWQSIKAAVTRIFAEIAGSFISGLLKKMIAGIGGTAVAGAVGGAAAGTAAGAAGGAGVAAGLGGLGASAAAFATNPFTLAIAGGIGAFFLGRKLFGGGEETKVNPRRDQFQAQFGGGAALAALLTAQTGKPGGGSLFAGLQAADTIASFESSEKAIAGFLATHGRRNVKLFNMGGFVPPGAIQPAILHGGSFGEDIVPRGTSGATAVSLTLNISAIDAKGVRDFVESRDFTDSLDRAFVHNKRFLTTRVRSSLLP